MPEGSRKEPTVLVPGLREKFFCLGDADNAWGAKVFFFCFLVEIWEWRKDPGKKMEEKKSFWDLNSTVPSIKQILGILHDESFFFFAFSTKMGSGIVVFMPIFYLEPSWKPREKNCWTRIPSMSLKSVFERFFFPVKVLMEEKNLGRLMK